MRSIRFLLGAASLAMLAACSDGSVGGGATVSGGVVKGPVLGSTVCAFALTGGAKGAAVPLALGAGAAGSISGGCYVTPADGSYNFALPAGTSGDLLIEATGGTFCSNESQIAAGACTGGGTVINLGGAVMSSIVAVPAAGSNATVYTTPLTTAAVTGGGAGMTSARFNERFNTLAGRVIGAGTPVTPATPPTVANQPYLGTAATALQNGGTLSTIVTALNNGTTTFTATGGGTPATVNAAVVGTYNLKFYAGGGEGCSGGTVCPYSEGQDVPIVVNGDGTLSIPGKTLTNPFYRSYGGSPHLPEIIWLDTSTNLEYALSDNEGGTFNEINVGDASRPQGPFSVPVFLGQIRLPEVGSGTALAAIAGSYNFGQQYAGADVAWTAVSITADGVVTFTGTGPSVATAQTVTVSSLGGGAQIVYILPSGGVLDPENNIDNRIALYMDSPTHLKDIEYYVGASNVSTSKRGVSVVASGQSLASIGAPGTGTWAIPVTNAISGTVGSTTMTLSSDMFLSGSTGSGFQLIAQGPGGQQFLINVQNSTGGGVALNTNYSCVHGSRTKRIEANFNFSIQRNTGEGGNCNVYITHLEPGGGGTITQIEGRFTAEVYGFRRNDQALVLDGAFRYHAPPP